MAVAWPLGFEIDFLQNFISRSAACFLVIIFQFSFSPIFEITIHQKEVSFLKAEFHELTYI